MIEPFFVGPGPVVVDAEKLYMGECCIGECPGCAATIVATVNNPVWREVMLLLLRLLRLLLQTKISLKCCC